MKKLLLLTISLFAISLHAQYDERDIEQYILDYHEIAIRKMAEYKIPASITLAQGIFESGCGKSRLAIEGHNHFGIKCHKEWTGDTILVDDDELQECFRKYASVEESYTDHSLFLTTRKRYDNLFFLDPMDYVAWARTLQADGYATNPKYADRLIDLIQRFQIARFDTLYRQLPVTDNTAAIPPPTVTEPAATPTDSEPATKSNMKIFTAVGNDYPSGNSPFTYRKVFENNRTYFVIAQKNDTYEKIASDVQVPSGSLRKFNDASRHAQPIENEIVYIEAKGKTNPAKVHIVQKSETLRYISQRYGIQLPFLYKYNNLTEKSIIKPGDRILLKH